MSSTPFAQSSTPTIETSPSAFPDATGDASGSTTDGVGPSQTQRPSPALNGGAPSRDIVSPGRYEPPAPLSAIPAGATAARTGATLLSDEQFARVSKALADPRRFSILEIIAAHGEIACQQLCGDLPVKQATVSHHVKELSLAGLVETRRDGQYVFYRYIPSAAQQYLATLATRLQSTLPGQGGNA